MTIKTNLKAGQDGGARVKVKFVTLLGAD